MKKSKNPKTPYIHLASNDCDINNNKYINSLNMRVLSSILPLFVLAYNAFTVQAFFDSKDLKVTSGVSEDGTRQRVGL